jgi:hypothetical protein
MNTNIANMAIGLPETAPVPNHRTNPPASSEIGASLPYEPIPPKSVVTLSVRYRVRGRGRPLPYDLDEEPGE